MVSSLELSKELYELSGWEDTEVWFGRGDTSSIKRNSYGIYFEDGDIPAYSAGYLLRKLPAFIDEYKFTMLISNLNTDKVVRVGYQKFKNAECNTEHLLVFSHPKIKWQHGSPEDALCKLSIELFKSGVLESEHQSPSESKPKEDTTRESE